MYYDKLILPNGARIVTEEIPGAHTAAIGVWVGGGSRREGPQTSGASHFIEHMSFKGTARRTAAELAAGMDAIGGQMNAYTTKEETVYYAWVLDTHLSQAVDMLWDMLFSSKFDEADVDTERGVILEEMGMYADDPEDLCAERLAAAVYKGTPLARPILGRKATLEQFTGAGLRQWHREHYVPSELVIALAGRFTQAHVDDLRARCAQLTGPTLPPAAPARRTGAFTLKRKASEQDHLILSFPGVSNSDPRRFTLQLLSSVLGGGMSSRLWQQVREKNGLCYSIYTYGTSYADLGSFCVYTATGADTEARALSTIAGEIRRFVQEGIAAEELERAREQSKANVLMGLESTQAHMSALGRGELHLGQALSPEEVIAAYDAVTARDVQDLAGELLDFRNVSLSAVGRVKSEEEYRALLT